MKKILIVILVFLVVGCGASKDNEKIKVKSISSEETQKLIEENSDLKIIDVRTKEEYDSGHIVGAINIPVDNISSIDYSLDTKIIVYCQSGNRSVMAYKKLIGLGYTDVYNLGGIVDWPYEIVEE